MNQIAERWKSQRPVWIARQHRLTGSGERRVDGPVVAPLRRLELDGLHHVVVGGEERAVDPPEIDTGRRGKGDLRIGRHRETRLLDADLRHELRAGDLETEVEGDLEHRHAAEAVLRLPAPRPVAEDLELDREAITELLDAGVDAAREGGRDALRVRRVAGPLGIHVAPVPEQPGEVIPDERLAPEDFSRLATGDPAPQIDLEESILRRHEALRKEEVVLASGVDVRDAPAVAEHLDGLAQTGHRDLPFQLSQHAAGARKVIAGRARRRGAAGEVESQRKSKKSGTQRRRKRRRRERSDAHAEDLRDSALARESRRF